MSLSATIPCPALFLITGCEVLANGDLYLRRLQRRTGVRSGHWSGQRQRGKACSLRGQQRSLLPQHPVFLLGTSQANAKPRPAYRHPRHPSRLLRRISPDGGTLTGNVTLVTDSDTAYCRIAALCWELIFPVNSPNITGGFVFGSTNALPGGSYNVYAYYGGDTNYAASKSSPIPVTINPESSATRSQ
jgi:hypothetical protein